MQSDPDTEALASALRVSIGLLVRRLRQAQVESESVSGAISLVHCILRADGVAERLGNGSESRR
jgi:hypothetical protein